jgi:hypothetical protein
MRDIELVPDLATWYKVDFYVSQMHFGSFLLRRKNPRFPIYMSALKTVAHKKGVTYPVNVHVNLRTS